MRIPRRIRWLNFARYANRGGSDRRLYFVRLPLGPYTYALCLRLGWRIYSMRWRWPWRVP